MALFRMKPWYRKKIGKPGYYTRLNSGLPMSVYYNAANTIGDYVLLFGGRYSSNVNTTAVRAYNKNLTVSDLTNVENGVSNSGAASVGDYAFFGGGYNSNYSASKAVFVYDKSLVRYSNLYMAYSRSMPAATSVGNYVIFAGGGPSSDVYYTADIFNTSMTRSTISLTQVFQEPVAARNSNYAIIMYGDNMRVYNSSLTYVGGTAYKSAYSGTMTSSSDDFAIFAGGDSYDTVMACDTSNTSQLITSLTSCRGYGTGCFVEGYSLFAFGFYNNNYLNTIEIYDKYLSKLESITIPVDYFRGRAYLASASTGNYALFAGGYSSNSNGGCSLVDIVKVA